MKEENLKSEVEIFICNHKRDGDKSCAEKGAKELTDKVKKWTKENYGKKVKVFRSGCLGKCSEGIAIACFPDKKMLLEVSSDDSKEVKRIIEDMAKPLLE